MSLCQVLQAFLLFYLSFCNSQNIIDLSWEYTENTLSWTANDSFTFSEKIATTHERGFWYSKNTFCVGEHSGTHFDAPYHSNKDGFKVGDIPLEKLIAEGAFIDMSNETEKNGAETLLKPQHLQEWQTKNGPFKNNTVLLIKFNWSKYWPNRKHYYGEDNEGNKKFPGLLPETAELIANTGTIVGVGVDVASVDPGNSQDFLVHRILNKKNLYMVENLKILNDLPAKDFMVLVMPMKIKEGSGAPTRVVAIPKGIL